jgi:drug/metabolite transporter (DMT)-like permease
MATATSTVQLTNQTPTANASQVNVLIADLLLLLAAFVWGIGFVAQRLGMIHLGPLAFNGARFLLGALCLIPILIHRRPPVGPGLSRKQIFGGVFIVGGLLFLGATLQQWGLVSTTARNGGFLTGLYVVLVPLFGRFMGLRPGWGSWVGALLCTFGIYFLSSDGDLRAGWGDLLVLVGSLMWAFHFLALGYFARLIDPLFLAFAQFLVCAALSFVGAILFEPMSLAPLLMAAGPLVYSGFVSIGLGYTLQVFAQKRAPPTHTAILLSLESVFGALAGWLFLAEPLTAKAGVGCTLMLTGVLLAQLRP